MATIDTTLSSPRPAGRSVARIFWLEAKTEFLKLVRLPAYAIPTIAFPVLFYVLFGLSFNGGGGDFPMATYLIASYGVFGIVGAALFGFGVGVAIERGQGWMLLKRATPMPPSAYFFAKLVMAMLFASIIVGSLFILGAAFGGVRLDLGQWLTLGTLLILGTLPFCAMGLAIGTFAGPNSAPAIVNVLYLPMAFCAGLWVPIQALPSIFKTLAPAMPPYHLAQLAQKVTGLDQGQAVGLHIAALAAFTIGFLVIAFIGYRRNEDKSYG